MVCVLRLALPRPAMQTLDVLVIDDDPVFLRIIQGILVQDATLTVRCMEDPLQALDSLQSAPPGLLLLDMNMPTMTGVKFIARLAELRFAGNVILVSGYEKRILESVRDYATSLGISIAGILNKPLDRAALHGLVAEARRYVAPYARRSLYSSAAELSGREVRAQLDSEHLVVVYQPSYRMSDGRLRGVEALARWKQAERLLPPDAFMPAIYSEGLISRFSLLVYEQMLRDLTQLHAAGQVVTASINLSVLSLADNEFVAALCNMAASHGVDLRHIVIEVSEKQVFGNISLYLDNILALIFRGCRISIDNFGGGHFALSLLRQIPFSEMKIDRSFVCDARKDSRSSIILRNSVRLGLDFGMQVVAVGGESQTDWDFCRELGCDYFQGFHKSSPLLFGDLMGQLQTQG